MFPLFFKLLCRYGIFLNFSLIVYILINPPRIVKSSVKHQIDVQVNYAKSNVDFNNALHGWKMVEFNATSPLAGDVDLELEELEDSKKERRRSSVATFDSSATLSYQPKSNSVSVSVPQILNEITSRGEQHSQVLLHDYGEKQLEYVVLDAIRFEIKVAMNWQKALENVLIKAKKSDKTTREAMKYRIVNAENLKPFKSNANLQKKKSRIENEAFFSAVEYNCYHKGLLGLELLRYRQQRTIRAMRIHDHLVQMHLGGVTAIRSVWSDHGMLGQSATSAKYNMVTSTLKPALTNNNNTNAQKAEEKEAKIKLSMVQNKIREEERKLEALKAQSTSLSASNMASTQRIPPTRHNSSLGSNISSVSSQPRRLSSMQPVDDVIAEFWTLVFGLMAAESVFALVLFIYGRFSISLPVWLVVLGTFAAGRIVDFAHNRNSPSFDTDLSMVEMPNFMASILHPPLSHMKKKPRKAHENNASQASLYSVATDNTSYSNTTSATSKFPKSTSFVLPKSPSFSSQASNKPNFGVQVLPKFAPMKPHDGESSAMLDQLLTKG